MKRADNKMLADVRPACVVFATTLRAEVSYMGVSARCNLIIYIGES